MDSKSAVGDASKDALSDLKTSKFTHASRVKSVLMAVLILASVIMLTAAPAAADISGNVTVLNNITSGFVIPTLQTSLGIWMQEPLIYVLATIITIAIVGAVAGIIKGRRKGRG